MIIFIILIALIIIGIVLTDTSFEDLGNITACISILLLLIHIPIWALTSYGFKSFMVARDSYEQTLQHSREFGNDFERAAIVKDIAEWNTTLAISQYRNKLWLLDAYIDDRVDLLEPIK